MKINRVVKLTEGHKLERDLSLTADAVIVGSGAAGAVIACELAEAGLDVVVLEEGGYYTAEDFNQLEHEMYPLLYMRRANQTTADLSVNVLQGRCLGGGTVVNMADCVRIHDQVLARWRKEFGVSGLDNSALAPSYERVERAIGVNEVRNDQLNRNNEILREGCNKLGYRGGNFMHNRLDCQECGYCLIGCAYDSKQSTLITYIPRALSAGARIFTDARVERVVTDKGRAIGVAGRLIDKKDGSPVRRLEVKAKLTVLSAGTINTPQILARTGICQGSGQLGRNLSLQPQAPVMALFNEKIDAHRGVPQSWYCDEFEQINEEYGERGFRLEGIMGGPSMASTIMPGFGIEHKKMMERYSYCAAILLLVPDQPAGSVTFDDDFNPKIEYDFMPAYIEDLRKGLQSIARVWLAAGAEMVMMPFEKTMLVRNEEDVAAIAQVPIEPNRLKFISAHPQGTCRMGDDPKSSVVDSHGFAHQVERLMICDASIFPTSAASHNMVPIMAIADYFSQNIKALRDQIF